MSESVIAGEPYQISTHRYDFKEIERYEESKSQPQSEAPPECGNVFENKRGERFACALPPSHKGPHESGDWEWWDGGPEVRDYFN